MKGLLATQYHLMQGIESIFINFKKDGPERKTYSNVQRRIATLQTYWNEFNGNHAQLSDYENVNEDYFKQNWYEATKSYYEKLLTYLELFGLYAKDPATYVKPVTPSLGKLTETETSPDQETRKEEKKLPAVQIASPAVIPRATTTRGDGIHPLLSKPKSPLPNLATAQQPDTLNRGNSNTQSKDTINRGNPSRLEEMLRKQNSNFKAFSRTITNINFDTLSEKWKFEDVLKNIESRWAAIDSLHWDIDSELYEEDQDYERVFSRYEREYNDIKEALNQKMWNASYKTQSTPTMDIPVFFGDDHKWVSFKDLFTEAIHNNRSISDAQKMQFLKSKVKGEAERLIQHLNISSENYQVCWNILNHRYNNMKKIFSSHFDNLMSLPTMQQQTAPLIKKIHDTANESLNAIKALGVDPMLVHILSQKLDAETHEEYIKFLTNPRTLPSLSDFFTFLENKFTSLEASKRKQDNTTTKQKENMQNSTNTTKKAFEPNFIYNKRPGITYKPIAKAFSATSANKCIHCSGHHAIYNCKDFIDMPTDSKMKLIHKYRLCVNCLYDHKGKKCISTKTCRKCTEPHNTLLHDAFMKQAMKPNTENVNVSQNQSAEILLATAQIKVLAADGSYHSMRALIDQGSQISLITENAAQKLGLSRRRCKGVVFGLGAQENNCKGAMNIVASAIHGDFSFETNVFIMKNLINNLPNQTFQKPTWSHIENINLADPEFYVSRPVDLLLGADIYARIMLGGIIKGNNDSQPMAQQTHLGWLLCGSVKTYQCNVILNNLDEIERFWSIEDIADNPSNMSVEDHHCVQQYKEQTTRQADGRYIVRLPMKPDTMEKLGESKQRAIAQFLQLEKKFSKNQQISDSYKSFINEYIELGHMSEARSSGNPTPACYLPHHCVLRAESTTTALRVVFNASSPTSSGHCLNDLIHCGPNLQQDLLSLILRWRQYKVAFTADIEKMFRQILVHQDDQNLQKIIWRDTPNQLLREYNLATVTYGMKAAPFLAMMTLKQLAIDEGHKYSSTAKQALEEDFYMDDLLIGSHSIAAAKQLQQDLINLLKAGGFNLRKWSCNKSELLQDDSTNQQGFNFKYPESTKTLGLRWNPQDDQFTFQLKFNSPSSKPLTKRVLLSEISKVFDPVGWLSGVTTKLKLLFQQVWQHEVQWDSRLPEEISKEWYKIREELENINNIKVQRWLETGENEEIELHGFCDSSTKAYACVIYCKVKKHSLEDTQGSSVTILAAKARLVPLKKKITLPRLELMSCLLLSKLMEKVLKSLPNQKITMFGWSDSTAALGWLQGDSNRWKPFVANRVEQIRSIMPSDCWRHVKSAENPADCASRGITVKQLQEHQLWWNGPDWLLTYKPEKVEDLPAYVTEEELKKVAQTNVATTNQDDIISDIVNTHSSFLRATRVLAWVLRAIIKNPSKENHLSVDEISKARQKIIYHHQHQDFSNEIANLKIQEKISPKSKILDLNPFLDQDGLLRVGGRIKHANISQEMKHPLIIPHDGHLTDLLIDQAHRDTFHGGPRLTLARLLQHYWVVGGNRAVKKCLRTCVTCRRHNPAKQNQFMGDLPAVRINPTRPFFNTGVDFTGYVDVKANKGRGIKTTKGYIAVFVCMVTKAVHLELVSDLSSSAFLAAMRRMAARRGAERSVYCDNGTNFVGASRILKQEFINLQAVLDHEFFEQISDMEIEVHFNAPSWPSAGGLWESAVKSLKHHLRRVLGKQKLTFEEFSTLLSQLEACLNTRPLCSLSEDPEDIDFLTPSHFLASGPTMTIIETERDERTRWQLTQKIFDDVWRRWQTDYLCQLSKRSKWQQPQQNQKIGDIVIIHDANLPAGKWSLGRVIELHPGKDGLVRVVSVKTKNGVIQRPIIKLSTLPINNESRPESNHSEEQQNSNTKKSRSKPVTSTFKTMAITLLMMLLVLPANCAYNIAQLKSNQSIYFDKISDMHLNRDEWKLVAYYDMNPYWDGCQMLTSYLNSLGNTCHKENKPPLCDVIMLQLRHSYVELDLYNHMLLGQQIAAAHPRARRGLINGVGNIARSLFGVLDDKFAEQYEKDIQQLQMNQKHMAMLWKNQTSIVEAEHNLLQRVEQTMDTQYKLINQHFNKMEKMANTMKDELQSTVDNSNFALSVITANNVLQNLKKVQEYLLDTIVDLHSGTFNIHLISPEQLRDELNIISGQLSKELSLPINSIPNDLSKLYHMLKVKAKMTKQFFIFEIRIPLIARDYFEIYHLIPIQHKMQNSMISIIPISEYIAMNIQKDLYFPISPSDLQRCTNYNDVTYLCPLQRPVYHMTSDNSLCINNNLSKQCKIITETCKTTWNELYQVNTHLYSSCTQDSVRIICGSQVTVETLFGSGIISLSEGCIIKGTTFTIFSHRQQNNALHIEADVLKIEIPSINHIIDLPFVISNDTKTQDQMNHDNHEKIKKQFEEIGEQIHQIRESGVEVAQADRASSHDIVQYVMIILGIIICTSVVLAWRRVATCRRSRGGRSAEAPAPAAPVAPRAPRPRARAAPPAHTPPPPPAARPPRDSLSDQPVHQHQSAGRIHPTSDNSDIELTDVHYATVAHKATSPTFRNHFSK